MKLLGIFAFEFGYQVRRAWPWLIFAALLVFSFLMTRDGTLAEALFEDFFLNSPFAIAKTTVFGSLIWIVAGASVTGEAAARDVATRMHSLLWTAPVSKAEYLGGKFLSAFFLNAIILLAVPAGILLAVYSPGVDNAIVGPFRASAYLTSYAFLTLPTAFVATAFQFALAARTGRPMTAYLGSLILFFLGFFVAAGLLFGQPIGEMVDPIGIRFIVDDLSRDWTTIEKSWRLVELKGTVLRNRLLWLGIGGVVLFATYLQFRFEYRSVRARRLLGSRFFGGRRWRAVNGADSAIRASRQTKPSTQVLAVKPARSFGFSIRARQTLAIMWSSFRWTAKSWAGFALLVIIPIMTVAVINDQMEVNGVPLLPVTAQVIGELTAPLSAELSRWVIVPLFVVYFAGELIWREREAGLDEITDSMPWSAWIPLLGKFLGLSLLLALFTALLCAAGMLAQMTMDFTRFEVLLYIKVMFGLQLPEYLLFAVLALAVHTIVNQKYIGHLVAVIAYVIIALAPVFGIEHNLFIYGSGPQWSYTEMRGFGPSVAPWLWFKLYWGAWAILLAVVARLFWLRGRDAGLQARIRTVFRRLTGGTAWTAALAASLILVAGGFVFYNTNVLNEYLTEAEAKSRRAEYERLYRASGDVAQPQLSRATLQIEIYPNERVANLRGSYLLVNNEVVPMDTIHVTTAVNSETREVTFDRPASPLLIDEKLGHRTYTLDEPLQPGESLEMAFDVLAEPRGFREDGVDLSVTEKATFFTNEWLPSIGYQRSRELIIAADRRKHGLAPRPMIPSLYEAEERKRIAGGIAFEAVVGTSEDQIAVAPGSLQRSWTEKGRRYFRYTTNTPIGGEWAFASARYAVRDASWSDPSRAGAPVAIRIFHHPGRDEQVDRILDSVRSSLDYYSREFGPYLYDYLNVVERPGEGSGLHAEPTMVSYQEGFSLWRPEDNAETVDLPYAVIAHEMAHQWTVPYAAVEGAPVMSESIAWYYAMRAVEESRGEPELRRLLSFMRQPNPYPPIRRGEPLLRGLDPYLAYRKGPFALYALSEHIGMDRMNQALKSLLAKHRQVGARLATTLDLYTELDAVTPDTLKYLLHDLFEVNTEWELSTENVRAEEGIDGNWEVMLDIHARKVVVDETGVEREVPMNDWVEVGVFAPSKTGEPLGEPLYLQRHRLETGRHTITVTVPNRPERAGLDPDQLLPAAIYVDNVRKVTGYN